MTRAPVATSNSRYPQRNLSLSLFFFALIVRYAHDQMYYANAVISTEVFFVLDMSKSINLNELIVEQDY